MTKQGKKGSGDPDWQAIPENVRNAIKSAWAYGMPPLSTAIYGRWWQLESWLRSLVYVELRAQRGAAWADALPKGSETRQDGDKKFRYMKTPDSQNLLAYADASALFNITVEHWELFEHALLSKNVWAGRIALVGKGHPSVVGGNGQYDCVLQAIHRRLYVIWAGVLLRQFLRSTTKSEQKRAGRMCLLMGGCGINTRSPVG